jgi:hypothetical protein
MDETVFIGYGIEILKRNDHFFVRYDAGEIAVKMREDEITAEEVTKAQKSERDAYEVLLSCEKRI